ncbi:MAG TPA: glycosyl hydrolase, partial [Bacteroidota bacterium]|nr:glycosyl hydrolase [Bacteroidota bacterium]
VVPIHDLAIQAREKDLVAGTHGRSFWILDNLTPLYQLNDEMAQENVYLYAPRKTYRMEGGTFDRPGLALGKNPPNGVVVNYYLRNKPIEKDTFKLEFLGGEGNLIKSFLGKSEKKTEPGSEQPQSDDEPKAPVDSGMNRFVWDMRYPDAAKVQGAIMWGGSTRGPITAPGSYRVRLKVGARSWTQSFEIMKDPRLETTPVEFKEQFDFLIKIRDKVSEAHEAVNTIRDIRKQTEDLVKKLEKQKSKDTIANVSKKLNEQLKTIEEAIIQVKIKSSQDALNFPIKLNDKIASLAGVASSADTKPTKQTYTVYEELAGELDDLLKKYRAVLENELVRFNTLVKDMEVPAVILKPKDK